MPVGNGQLGMGAREIAMRVLQPIPLGEHIGACRPSDQQRTDRADDPGVEIDGLAEHEADGENDQERG